MDEREDEQREEDVGVGPVWDLALEETELRLRTAQDRVWRTYERHGRLGIERSETMANPNVSDEEIERRAEAVLCVLREGPASKAAIATLSGETLSIVSRTVDVLIDEGTVVKIGTTGPAVKFALADGSAPAARPVAAKAKSPTKSRAKAAAVPPPIVERMVAKRRVEAGQVVTVDDVAAAPTGGFRVRILGVVVECDTVADVLALARGVS